MKSAFVRFASCAACAVAALIGQCAQAIETRPILETYFQTGDVPTSDQFKDLIDSFINVTDDGLTLYAIGANTKSTGLVALNVGKNVGINETLPDTVLHVWRPVEDPSGELVAPMCDEFCGTSGFLPLQYQDTSGQFHYGFLQIDMGDDPGASPGAPIYVTQWAWETSANTAITTFAVPEPTALVLLVTAIPMAFERRGKRRC